MEDLRRIALKEAIFHTGGAAALTGLGLVSIGCCHIRVASGCCHIRVASGCSTEGSDHTGGGGGGGSGAMSTQEACRWLWNSGGGADACWTAYSSSESAQIERLFAAGADRCALEAERHVDFSSMRQVRDDNPSRYRAIRREPPAGPSGAEAGATVLAAQEAAAAAPSASTSAAAAPDPAEATVAPAGAKRMRASDASIGGGDRSGSSSGNASGNSDIGGARDDGNGDGGGDGGDDGGGEGGDDGGNIFQAKRQSLAPIVAPRIRMGTPSVPLHPPSAPASWPSEQTEYVVLLSWPSEQEDPAFRAMLKACRSVCSATALQLYEQCVQKEGTRHVTLLKGLKLTRDEAMRVYYSSPPTCLPMRLSPERRMPWESCIALGFSSKMIPEEDLAALADLRGLPSRLSSKLLIKPSELHISLYRTGRPSLSKQDKDEAKRLIPNIRAACDGVSSFGSVLGTKIVLKPIGGNYDDARVLA